MKRKPILLDKLVKKGKHPPRETIGIIGTHRGAGVTFTGLMLAVYNGGELGKKTAFLECNGHHDLDLLESAYEWNQEDTASFTWHRITYYKNVAENRISEIFCGDFECMILDFGTDFDINREEFLRCGTKIIIGGRTEWEQQKLISFVASAEQAGAGETWIHLIPQAGNRTVTHIRKEIKRKAWSVPFEENPMLPSKNIIRLFDNLFRS